MVGVGGDTGCYADGQFRAGEHPVDRARGDVGTAAPPPVPSAVAGPGRIPGRDLGPDRGRPVVPHRGLRSSRGHRSRADGHQLAGARAGAAGGGARRPGGPPPHPALDAVRHGGGRGPALAVVAFAGRLIAGDPAGLHRPARRRRGGDLTGLAGLGSRAGLPPRGRLGGRAQRHRDQPRPIGGARPGRPHRLGGRSGLGVRLQRPDLSRLGRRSVGLAATSQQPSTRGRAPRRRHAAGPGLRPQLPGHAPSAGQDRPVGAAGHRPVGAAARRGRDPARPGFDRLRRPARSAWCRCRGRGRRLRLAAGPHVPHRPVGHRRGRICPGHGGARAEPMGGDRRRRSPGGGRRLDVCPRDPERHRPTAAARLGAGPGAGDLPRRVLRWPGARVGCLGRPRGCGLDQRRAAHRRGRPCRGHAHPARRTPARPCRRGPGTVDTLARADPRAGHRGGHTGRSW